MINIGLLGLGTVGTGEYIRKAYKKNLNVAFLVTHLRKVLYLFD